MTYFLLSSPAINSTSWGTLVNNKWLALNNAFSDSGQTLIIGASGSAYTALSLCTGGSQCVWIDASGRLGVGGAPVNGYGRLQSTFSDTAVHSGYVMSNGASFFCLASPTSASTGTYIGSLSSAQALNANATNREAVGILASVTLQVSSAPASISEYIGVSSGLYVVNDGSSGTATMNNAFGVYVNPVLNAVSPAAATIDTLYGIYLGAPTITGNGSVGTAYGVYQADPAASNYFAGAIDIATAGKGLQVKEGANCKQGTASLFSGAVTVANASVTANSRIFLTIQSLGGVSTPMAIAVTSPVAGTSFTIQSASSIDTSVIAYEIFEPG